MFPLREGDTEGQRIHRGGPRLLVNVTVADCDVFWYSRHMQSADSEAFCTLSGFWRKSQRRAPLAPF
jgi:hypothetical protein